MSQIWPFSEANYISTQIFCCSWFSEKHKRKCETIWNIRKRSSLHLQMTHPTTTSDFDSTMTKMQNRLSNSGRIGTHSSFPPSHQDVGDWRTNHPSASSFVIEFRDFGIMTGLDSRFSLPPFLPMCHRVVSHCRLIN